MDRDALADFLKRRREALTPADLGLAEGGRRRTQGLRREEVAALAYMSTDFYTRLEQRRGARPSVHTIAALARALRLNAVEADHLFALAGHVAPPRALRGEHPSPELLRVLDRLDTPAQIVSHLSITLSQNRLAVALVGDQTHYSGLQRSLVYRWFTDPASRRFHAEAEHAMLSRQYAASLRAVSARSSDDPEMRRLVDALLEESPEFAELWERHEVGDRIGTLKTFVHPVVGTIALDCQVLIGQNPSERLVVFTATPGSEDAQRLAVLAAMVHGTRDKTA
ncbi:MAG TPA: helix-turn-helix transcriptional regulator [Candidatus Elarobacter sp.]|jgi:transcriptional regulator with XRE-family HTH domain